MTHRCTKCGRSSIETKFSLRDSKASSSTLRSQCCECSNAVKRKPKIVQPLHPETIGVMRLLQDWTTTKDVAEERRGRVSSTRMIIIRLIEKGLAEEVKLEGKRCRYVCLTDAGFKALEGPAEPVRVALPPVTSNPWEALGWNERPNWRAAA